MFHVHKKGQSVIEYVTLIIFIAVAILVIQKYIVRGISGRWKSVGDTFGFERQYDPQKTYRCAFDFKYTNTWYDENCYDFGNPSNVLQPPCDCDSIRVHCSDEECVGKEADNGMGGNLNILCIDCIKRCATWTCNENWSCVQNSDCTSPLQCLNHQCTTPGP